MPVFFLTPDHFRLRAEGIAVWRQLEAEHNGLYAACGAFHFDGQGDGEAERLTSLGYPVRDLNEAEFARHLPGITVPKGGALHFPDEGAADAPMVARRLLAISGARLLRGVAVDAIETDGDRVASVRVPGGRIAAETVVVACGTGAPGLVEPLGVPLPLLKRPGMTLVSDPVSLRLNSILVTPAGEIRQLPGQRMLASTEVNHQGSSAESYGAPPSEIASLAAARLSEWLPVSVTWREVRAANRPMPADGLPVIGQAGPDGLWIAVMHSGVTLGPVVGQLLASEIAAGREQVMLRPFRPGRFSP